MKLGLHYSFQTHGEQSREVIAQGLREIVIADDDGFSATVFAEHHFHVDGWIPRPMLLASAAAAVTSRMRIGTNIVILPLHHPVGVAEEAAVLDVLSGGRAILGVALGWVPEEFDGFGVPYDERIRIFKQSILNVKALLRGEAVDSDGHYSFRGAQIRPLPVAKGGVPVWAGAVADSGVRRVARLADAWVMPPMPRIKELRRQKELFDMTRAESGLPPATEQPLRREVFVAESEALGWKAFAPGIRHEYGEIYRQFDPSYPDNDTVSELRKWGEELFPVGPPESVATQLAEMATELSATEVLVRFQLPGISSRARSECFEGLREVVRYINGM